MSDERDNIEGQPEGTVLVAEYVLGLMAPELRADFERRLDTDPALRAEVAEWQQKFSGLDSGFEPVAPPPHAFANVEKRLFGDGTATRAGLWEHLGFWRGLALAGLAVSAVSIGLNVLRPAPLNPDAFATQLVAALEAEGSAVKFLALYDGTTGEVRLAGLAGEEVPDKDFELWFIKGSDAPISMGVIPANQRSEVEVPQNLRQAFGEGTVLAITLEPKGGSPSGKPTGPVIASGPALKV